jgi:hypothetical protein
LVAIVHITLATNGFHATKQVQLRGNGQNGSEKSN